LNFVNNFSELSDELINELEELLARGEIKEVTEILKSLRVNLEKINHHGKRADNIVKSMLLHSRQNTGEKQPTDINALTDEYLKLAYHGLRAKDKTFNASIKTEYDKSIGPMNIVQQDMGRVILNLTNNAFYAVSQKRGINGYEPTIVVSTKRVDGRVEISIRDNGNGIPQHIVDKIFQPFFTTKPAGQGTGLGLSLSYDVVQAHGGNIEVRTEEGKGSEFRISLPA
jgi:signal transduction histidine kinase